MCWVRQVTQSVDCALVGGLELYVETNKDRDALLNKWGHRVKHRVEKHRVENVLSVCA